VAQDLRYPLRGKLARSAGARGIIDQAFFAAEKQHAFSFGQLISAERGTASTRQFRYFFFTRAPTSSSTRFSSGKAPVLSLE
jgi:hypothetical protein